MPRSSRWDKATGELAHCFERLFSHKPGRPIARPVNRMAVRLNWQSSSVDGDCPKIAPLTGAFKKLSPCEAMDLTHQFSP